MAGENSQLSHTVRVPIHSEKIFTERPVLLRFASIELIGGLIPLDLGILLKDKIQLLEHLKCSMMLKATLKSRF